MIKTRALSGNLSTESFRQDENLKAILTEVLNDNELILLLRNESASVYYKSSQILKINAADSFEVNKKFSVFGEQISDEERKSKKPVKKLFPETQVW